MAAGHWANTVGATFLSYGGCVYYSDFAVRDFLKSAFLSYYRILKATVSMMCCLCTFQNGEGESGGMSKCLHFESLACYMNNTARYLYLNLSNSVAS